MEKTKVAVIYYSMTGTNLQMARWAADEAEKNGAEVRLLRVKELAPQEVIESNPLWKKTVEEGSEYKEATAEDIVWADAIIFSVPTRFGNVASQMKQFIDTMGGIWAKGLTANKVVSAMSSAQNPHGGQEATILSLYTSMYHWGAIVAAPGYTEESVFTAGGNPYGTSVTVKDGKMVEGVEPSVRYQAKRTIEVADAVKGMKK